jgi:WhiB family transcriptional regulator, redox-sensing transcriptional regulator
MRLDDLMSVLTGIPDLPGARCKSRSHIWESDDPELQEYAIHQCGRDPSSPASCPALQACSDWLEDLKPSKRPQGVVAGKVIREHGKEAA